jgi:hypothetical protein
MFEIGDDLPTLGASAERLSLVKNADLIDMARLGRASTPIDLMTYSKTDQQPSVFLLKENERQSILTVFNSTDEESTHPVNFARLGLKEPGKYRIAEVFGEQSCCAGSSDTVNVVQKPHSVRMLKLIDESVPAIPPSLEIRSASSAKAGDSLTFAASASSIEAPVLNYHWDFGDGTNADGREVQHAFTHSGDYNVQVTAVGLDAAADRKTLKVSVSGEVSTRFEQANKQRPQ